MDVDFKQEKKRTKNKVKRGYLTSAIIFTILILVPVVSFIAKFIYEMEFKEHLLVISHSLNDVHTIEIVEKGAATFFGPSTVRIKHVNSYIDCNIRNDGATLQPSNVSVTWQSDDKATITLIGDEQMPKIVKFKVTNHNESAHSFKEVQNTSGF